MTGFCNKLAMMFYKWGIIDNKEDINPLRFSFELMITQCITYLSIIICGILFNKNIETLLYILLFTILRKNIQGYHANTFHMCYILTILNYFIVLFLLRFNLPYYFINLIIIFVVVFGLEIEERKIVYLITLLYAIALFIFYMMNNIYMIQMYSLTYGIVLLMKYVGVGKNKEIKEGLS